VVAVDLLGLAGGEAVDCAGCIAHEKPLPNSAKRSSGTTLTWLGLVAPSPLRVVRRGGCSCRRRPRSGRQPSSPGERHCDHELADREALRFVANPVVSPRGWLAIVCR
jgi:hypothetical protein